MPLPLLKQPSEKSVPQCSMADRIRRRQTRALLPLGLQPSSASRGQSATRISPRSSSPRNSINRPTNKRKARQLVAETKEAQGKGEFKAPHPGSSEMPRWDTGELIDAPRFTWKNWFAMLGPGLVLGGASIGGGEWLLGARVSS